MLLPEIVTLLQIPGTSSYIKQPRHLWHADVNLTTLRDDIRVYNWQYNVLDKLPTLSRRHRRLWRQPRSTVNCLNSHKLYLGETVNSHILNTLEQSEHFQEAFHLCDALAQIFLEQSARKQSGTLVLISIVTVCIFNSHNFVIGLRKLSQTNPLKYIYIGQVELGALRCSTLSLSRNYLPGIIMSRLVSTFW